MSQPVQPAEDDQGAHADVNKAIVQRLASLARDDIALLVARHIRSCQQWDSCSICGRARECLKRSQERKRRQRKRRLWGVLKSIIPLLALHRRAAEKTYRPGGLGYEAARSDFHDAQLDSLPCTN